MAGNEELVLWLTQKLQLERSFMREQHRLQYAFMEERHMQVLVDMKAMLAPAAPLQEERKSKVVISEEQSLLQVSENKERPLFQASIINERQKVSQEPLDGQQQSTQSSVKNGNSATPSSLKLPQEPANGEIKRSDTVDSSHERRHAYKSSALQNLAGPGQSEPHYSLFGRMVEHPAFEAVSGIMIIVNTLILACEIEYQGFDSAYLVGYEDYRPSEESWPGLADWFRYTDIAFVTFFTIELLIRIAAAGKRCPFSGWIWFDTIIVGVSWFGISPLSKNVNEGVDPTTMRVARLARMLRAFKMVRMIRAFDSLYLLIRSIQASVGALFWSFGLLIFMQVACGLCISQMLQQYLQNESYDIVKRKKVFLYYGTFTRTMVTMFEITLANWTVSCRVLMDNVTPWYGLFYILYSCCFVFAVIRVIQAVFIAETNRVVSADDQIAIRRKEQEKDLYLRKLNVMFEELDASGDGLLTEAELQKVYDDKLLKALMSTLGINVNDLEVLFKLLDNGDGEIEINEFVTGLSRVKGAAQAIDLVSLCKVATSLEEKVDAILSKFDGAKPRASVRSRSVSRRFSNESMNGDLEKQMRMLLDQKGASPCTNVTQNDPDALTSEYALPKGTKFGL